MKIRYIVTGPGVTSSPEPRDGEIRGRIFDSVDEAVSYGREVAYAHPDATAVMVTEEVVLDLPEDIPMIEDRGIMVPDRTAIGKMQRFRMMWNSRQINDDHVAPPLPRHVFTTRLGMK